MQALEWMVQQRLLLLLPDFISESQSQSLIEEVLLSPSIPAPVDDYGATPAPVELRKTTLFETQAKLNQEIIRPLENISEQLQTHFQLPLTRHELPQFLRYQPGDFFKPHTDISDAPIYRERRLSLILCLNDHRQYQGGRLAFFLSNPEQPGRFLGVPVPPKTGLLIAFLPELLHEVSTVTSGERFTAVTWLAS
jgi:predicted 2-oxoglutarate/Fe(II)-dependent dioxygenase YbiX